MFTVRYCVGEFFSHIPPFFRYSPSSSSLFSYNNVSCADKMINARGRAVAYFKIALKEPTGKTAVCQKDDRVRQAGAVLSRRAAQLPLDGFLGSSLSFEGCNLSRRLIASRRKETGSNPEAVVW